MAASAIVLALLGWGFYYTRAAHIIGENAERIQEINRPMRAAEDKIDKLRQKDADLNRLIHNVIDTIH